MERLRQLDLSARKLARTEVFISEGEIDVTSFPHFSDQELGDTLRQMVTLRGIGEILPVVLLPILSSSRYCCLWSLYIHVYPLCLYFMYNTPQPLYHYRS
jgi:hypothetical protein